MNKQDLMVSKLLVIEERYLALKDFPKFKSKTGGVPEKEIRYVEHQIFLGYNVSAISMVGFAMLLTFTQLLLPYPLAHIQTLSIILYAYIFLVSLYSILIHTNAISTYRLAEPLRGLPADIGKRSIPLSWFIFTGSSSLFVIIPPLITYVYYTGLFYSVFIGLAWAFIMLTLGYIAGITLAFLIQGSGKERRLIKEGPFSNILRLLSIIFIFALFEIAVQLPQEIPILPLINGNIWYFFIPVLGVAYTAFNIGQPSSYLFFLLASTILYGIITYFLYTYVNDRALDSVTRGDTTTLSSSKVSGAGLHRTESGFFGALIWKDLRNMLRNPQNMLMVMIPAFLVLPTIISVFFFTSGVRLDSILIYYSMLTIVVLSSAFYSLILLVSEGNGIRLLQILPVGLKDLAFSKCFVGSLMFAFIMIPITIILFTQLHTSIIILVIFPLSMFIGFLYTSMYNIRRLLSKVPNGSSTLNYYTFGGTVELFVLFALTASMVGLPAVFSNVLSYLVHTALISSQSMFFVSTLSIDVVLMLFVMRKVRNTV